MEAGARARVTWDDAMRANWRHRPARTAAALAAGVAAVVALDLGGTYVRGARAVRAHSVGRAA